MNRRDRVLLLCAGLALCACVRPRPPTRGSARAAPSADALPKVARDTVAGHVLDERGQPVLARVAAVSSAGSLSVSTDRAGRFELVNLEWPEFSVRASDDARVAVEPRVVPGTADLDLVLRPAAVVTIELAGTRMFRCAVLQNGTRIEDVMVRPGELARVIVPPGEIVVQLYDAGGVRAERTAGVAVGTPTTLSFGSLEEPQRSDS